MPTGMGSNRSSYASLVEMQRGTTTLEHRWAVSCKNKHILPIRSTHLTPWHLPRGAETYIHTKNLHTDVYNSLICNCQNLKASRMSFSKWMDKQTLIHPNNRLSSSTKKKWTINFPHGKAWRNRKCILLGERNQSEKAAYCTMVATWHCGKGKTTAVVKRS